MNNTCITCKWFEYVENLLIAKHINKKVGYCHRMPPTLVNGVKKWPEMIEDDYCGEYTPKEPK